LQVENFVNMSSITPEELLSKIKSNENVTIVDVRPFSKYVREHIPKAIWFYVWDLTRHEENLPSYLKSEEELAKVLSKNGIDSDAETVVYCDLFSVTNASYFYFVLKYLGHEKVKVLEGGFERWVELQYPLEKGIVQPKPAKFIPKINREIKANYEEVKQAVEKKDSVIIDARREEEYKGKETTLPRAGRIPGSLNLPFLEFVEEKPFEINIEKVKSRLNNIIKEKKKIIYYCSSGPMATYLYYLTEKVDPNSKAKVYLESFIDWINKGEKIES
jgi:Rhodanese-related sulfurtransferase